MCFKAKYSIKKMIALSFLLLANAAMLAHAVICHHHDIIPVSLTAVHCEHDGNSCDHHHHDTQPVGQCNYQGCHDEIANCSLTIVYARFTNNKQVSQLLSFDFNQLPCILIPFSDYSAPQISDDANLPFRQKPYLISYHSEYISQSLGLRAPPL